ncbi:hypothetical protein A0O34_00435 [Chryseobacterium glaciei]|uniref:Uncharacterized protein n=1 Tax=Chryseobacterium glaciei TaxID=1685010 RepID=A0A172XQ24_9FLAO|nr:hypothetical protein [Chryseobacterium glaciei]ANF49113.1 hypothetical protein A0O34_00435 [Chryseobacterium glaciei]
MRQKTFSAVILFIGLTINAQAVGIGTASPATSSILELSATNKGFLAPRMTTANRTAIASPATGLQVYDTTTNTFWYYNGTVWVNSSAAASGDNLGNHLATQPLALNDNELRFRAANDGGQKLAYSATVDGPILTGYDGGALATSRDGSIKNILTWNNAGSVQVNGASTNTAAFDAGSGNGIDFSKSNLAYTTANPGTTFTLTGIKNGGTYTLSVRGTTSGTANFNASGFTVKYANNRATTAGTETLYTIIAMGTTVYIYTATGF